jgi:hypothetical protein
MPFFLDDHVVWVQRAYGRPLDRRGVVVAVVPTGEQPDRCAFRSLFRGALRLPARDHESYVVRGANDLLYWPRAKLLAADRTVSDALSTPRAERRWVAACREQAWNSETQVNVLENFIRKKGLMAEFADFACARARFERDAAPSSTEQPGSIARPRKAVASL